MKYTNIYQYMVSLLICCLISSLSEAAFKDLGWGVRPAGMGGAFTALADDVNASAWNPAGIIWVKEREVAFMYADLFAGLKGVDISLNYLATVWSNERIGPIGIFWARMHSPQYREETVSISYASSINPNLCWGVNLKLLRHSYLLDNRTTYTNDPVFADGTSKTAFTADIGMLFYPAESYSFGLCLKNITQPDVGLKSKDTVPVEWRLGGAYHFKEISVVAIDISKRDDDLNFHLGSEIQLMEEKIGLRAGVNLKELALGASYAFYPIGIHCLQLDYAIIYPFEIKGTSGTHRVSMILRW